MPIRVFTDKLQEELQEGYLPLEQVDPVDAFGGYVAVDKYTATNLQRTNDNIQWKTGLKPTVGFINTQPGEPNEKLSEDGRR